MKSHPTYQILDEIGHGSAATVYRAYDTALKRNVAIKELSEKFQGDPQQMEQFWEEAQFLANLKHDNIVQIHSFDRLFKGVGGGAADPELGWMRWHSSATEVLPPVQELMPSAPPDLARVIDKLLKKNVAERYATAAEALQDLEDKPLVLVEPAR